MNKDKIKNQIIEWLQEDEEMNVSDQNLESDAASEYSNHDTDSEQSVNSGSDTIR